METKWDKHKRYLDKLESHALHVKEAKRYSADRFDILLITLSTSSLALSIGFVKDIVPNYSCVDSALIKIAWSLFVITLVSNLISQVHTLYDSETKLHQYWTLSKIGVFLCSKMKF